MAKWSVLSSSNSEGLCGDFGFIELILGRRNVGLSLFMGFADINKNTQDFWSYPFILQL